MLIQRYRLLGAEGARSARSSFETLPGVELHPVTAEIADEAARIRASTNLLLPDAIHVATAVVAGADAFLTNDRQLLRAENELQILILDDLAGVS